LFCCVRHSGDISIPQMVQETKARASYFMTIFFLLLSSSLFIYVVVMDDFFLAKELLQNKWRFFCGD
jgi:hypothetical protein